MIPILLFSRPNLGYHGEVFELCHDLKEYDQDNQKRASGARGENRYVRLVSCCPLL
jgi:hypothetical protein